MSTIPCAVQEPRLKVLIFFVQCSIVNILPNRISLGNVQAPGECTLTASSMLKTAAESVKGQRQRTAFPICRERIQLYEMGATEDELKQEEPALCRVIRPIA